ncbi:MAG: hypothetical protein IJ855_05585 [Bacteroidales bacterium]|nr:hypothetical protein [Bacteroidales bacterium]
MKRILKENNVIFRIMPFGILIMVVFISSYCSVVQNNKIYGTYIKDELDTIILESNTFTLLYGPDTAAICHFSKVDNNYIEISSYSPEDRAAKGATIERVCGDVIDDIIKIEFDIPNYLLLLGKPALYIWITFDKSEIPFYDNNLKLDYSIDNRTIIIPRHTITRFSNNTHNKCYISISLPEQFDNNHDIYGTSYGIKRIFWFLELDLEGHDDSFIVNLPSIGYDFFSRFNIKGDYVQFKNNKLKWRGEYWIKVKQ